MFEGPIGGEASSRARLLGLLRGAAGPVPGPSLVRALRSSPGSLRHEIQALRQLGYGIDGRRGRGYRLRASPDVPYPWELEGIPGAPAGAVAAFYPEVDSTSDVARVWALAGASPGSVIVADAQRRGRGRRGRSWSSPPALGLWVSLLLLPALPVSRLSLCGLLVAVASCRALRRAGVPAGLKWPNDILCHGRKLAGILVESEAGAGTARFVIAGIGVNVNQGPEDFLPALAGPAISCRQVLGRPLSRVALLRTLLEEIWRAEAGAAGDDFAAVRAAARELSLTLGRPVRVEEGGRAWVGRAVDLAEDGSLVVEEAGGPRRRVYAGDVSVRLPGQPGGPAGA